MLIAGAFALACAACSGGIAVGPVTVIAPATATAGAPSVAISAGAPIVVSGSTPQLPASRDGKSLAPVAAVSGGILVRAGTPTDPAAPSSYELWNPTSGVLQPLLNPPAGNTDRVAGATGDWLVLLRRGSTVAPAAAATESLVLLNPTTGETRTLGAAGGAFGTPVVAVADGWIAWVAGGGQPGLHAYDLANGVDHLLPVRAHGISRLGVGGGSIAWWQRDGGQSRQVVVRSIASGQTHTIPVGSVDSLVLSTDGQTLAWLGQAATGEPGLFLSSLGTGTSGRLLGGGTVGLSLSASGSYIAWQPDPSNSSGVAGTYNVRTHELRLVQAPAGTATRLARLIGNWFVWSARPSRTASPSPSYFFPLAG